MTKINFCKVNWLKLETKLLENQSLRLRIKLKKFTTENLYKKNAKLQEVNLVENMNEVEANYKLSV
jgi:hypothetical protein